jgi:hypothetical protein
MSKKVDTPAVLQKNAVNDVHSGWGGDLVVARTPSGIKINFTSDGDGILRYNGDRDITDKLGPDRDPSKGPALVHSFYDGRNFVSLAAGFASKEAQLIPAHYYYIHLDAEIETGMPAPMKDYFIMDLGEYGTTVQVPPRISEDLKLTLTDFNIEALNYTRLNYPLRKS